MDQKNDDIFNEKPEAGKKRSQSSPDKNTDSPKKKLKLGSNDSNSSSSLKQPCINQSSEIPSNFIDARDGSLSLKTANSEANQMAGNVFERELCLANNGQVETISTNQKTDKKKGRVRKKAVLKAVKDQMEFYFSDCNLGKDRYLRKIYDNSENGYIDLAIFGNFNKLQSLHKDGVGINLLRKALKTSSFLELNENGSMVKRRTPLKVLTQEETNRRTVYVEHLPRHATHIWIQKIFSQCGRVCYVSLPVFKASKEIKGFAFVEFQSSEEAEKACKLLNNPPIAKAEEKPGRFPKGNKQLKSLQKYFPYKSDEEDDEESTTKSEVKDESSKKKKKKKSKKKGISEENNQAEVKDVKLKKKKKKRKRLASNCDEQDIVEEEMLVKEEKLVQENPKEENKETVNVKEYKGSEESTEVRNGSEIECSNKKKKKKKKKKRKEDGKCGKNSTKETSHTTIGKENNIPMDAKEKGIADEKLVTETLLSTPLSARKERKRLRQEEIRKKKEQKNEGTQVEETKDYSLDNKQNAPIVMGSTGSVSSDVQPQPIYRKRKHESDASEGSEMEDAAKVRRRSDGSELTSCLVKSKKQPVQKKVEFDPVPITTEFIKRKEVRRRKKVKRHGLHLRVITKKEWLSLRAEYISKQKAHMAALKNSLRELKLLDEQNKKSEDTKGSKHVDLADVFGTKRLKPSMDVKLAHLEKLTLIPNVIVQWKCSYEMPREKIRTMFKEIGGDSIAYIEAQEEAKSGYIRFKDEASAEEFAKISRSSDSFSARVLPESQQESYWEKANKDRAIKLSRKKHERGSERIARKVFERNKATFQQKPSHIVFDDIKEEADNKIEKQGDPTIICDEKKKEKTPSPALAKTN